MKYDEQTGIFLYDEMKQAFDEGLAQAISDMFPKTWVADLGSSLGKYAQFLYENGSNVDAFEGAKDLDFVYPTYQFDLTKTGRSVPSYPLVLCLEVGEHIPSGKETNFFKNLKDFTKDWLILSWAIPGQGGTGHVNCKSNKQVREKLVNLNFIFEAHKTEILREKSSKRWFKNSLMVFYKWR